MSLYPVKKRATEVYTTEFDILKASHKFLRTGEEDVAKSWDAQLAKKYEDALFKEFAVCDLKHYKSGNIALRWRTEDEVLSGAGETSCGNTRCPYHESLTEPGPSSLHGNRPKPLKLTTMELPFAYVEQGESEVRQAMVKVVLCERCVKKLLWKREKEKKGREEATSDGHNTTSRTVLEQQESDATHLNSRKSKIRNRSDKRDHRRQESRKSRSRSPRR